MRPAAAGRWLHLSRSLLSVGPAIIAPADANVSGMRISRGSDLLEILVRKPR